MLHLILLPKYSDPINIKTGNVILTDDGKSSTAPLIISGDTIDYVGHGFFTGDEVYYQPDEFVEYDADMENQFLLQPLEILGIYRGEIFCKKIR